MKRENLESKEFGLIIASRNFPFYAAPEADAVMDELEERIKELEAENERLKRELKQTEAQDQVVINGIRNALWMARVLRAHTEKLFYFNLGMNTISEKWAWAERKCIDKCIEKAKEFE